MFRRRSSHLGFLIDTYLQVTLVLPIKFGVNCPFGSGEEAKNRFSRWRPSWISDRNDFSYFWSTSHSDASYQVSSQLAQGCRRSRLLKQLLTPHDERHTTDIDWPQQLTMSTSCSGELKSMLDEIQVTAIYGHAILVAVASECCWWRFSCKIWTVTTGTLASDQGLHCLLKLQEVKGKMKQS